MASRPVSPARGASGGPHRLVRRAQEPPPVFEEHFARRRQRDVVPVAVEQARAEFLLELAGFARSTRAGKHAGVRRRGGNSVPRRRQRNNGRGEVPWRGMFSLLIISNDHQENIQSHSIFTEWTEIVSSKKGYNMTKHRLFYAAPDAAGAPSVHDDLPRHSAPPLPRRPPGSRRAPASARWCSRTNAPVTGYCSVWRR